MRFSSNPEPQSLPIADNNRELQERSLVALRNRLPAGQFAVRDERTEDAGVDLSLELLIDGRYTNLRAQVQMKSTLNPRTNEDGSISLSVPVRNLIYLLNGPHSPLYILYIAASDDLRFVWARDERARLDEDNPTWPTQESVTLRFVATLTEERLPLVRERIQREGRMQRQIHEVLGRATAGEIVRVCIEAETLRTTDPDEQFRLIVEQGITLVNGGKATEITEAAMALNPQPQRQPKVQLVLAYAYYMQSQFTSAVASLANATLRRGELTSGEQIFLLCLRDTCDYYTGRISFAEFSNRAASWNQGKSTESAFGIGYKLDELRYRLYSENGPSKDTHPYKLVEFRRLIVNEIRDFAIELTKRNDLPPILQLQAYLFWLQSEGTQIVTEDQLRWDKAGMRVKMKQPPDVERILRESSEVWARWESAYERGMEMALALEHPLPIADLYMLRASTQQFRFVGARAHSLIFVGQEIPEADNLVAALQEQLDKSIETYRQVEFLQGELHCRLIKAEILVMQGKDALARDEAEEILPIAEAMQYPNEQAHARIILAGRTVLQNARQTSTQVATQDEDFRMARESDERLHQFAWETLQNLEIPSERLPALERAIFVLRSAAKERVFWCRYLVLDEDLRHTREKATLYQKSPSYRARCHLLGKVSPLETSDAGMLIASFKAAYCKGCTRRLPKDGNFQLDVETTWAED